MKTLAGLLTLVCLAGCSEWTHTPVDLSPHLGPLPGADAGVRYEIWHGATSDTLIKVTLTPDSISGTRSKCDRHAQCRRSVPRNGVDSVLYATRETSVGEGFLIYAGALAGCYLFYLATIACEAPNPSCPLDHGK
jgi:hypothetical protein